MQTATQGGETTSVEDLSTGSYLPQIPLNTATPTSVSLLAIIAGQVITSGDQIGTIGDDGSARFCSASPYLCPSAVNYRCCLSGYECDFFKCIPTGYASQMTRNSYPSPTK